MTMTTTVNPRVAARAVGESPWRYFRKVFVATLNVAVMSIAVMMVIVSFATHEVAPGDYETFGHPVLSMLSGSMTPVISTGDLVVDSAVTPTQASALHVGQIISFRIAADSPVVITHRIIKVEHLATGVAYVTKGDANSSIDTPARPAANVIGVVAYRIPKGGYILTGLRRPVVVLAFLVAVLMALSVSPMIRWARRAERPSTTPDEAVS